MQTKRLLRILRVVGVIWIGAVVGIAIHSYDSFRRLKDRLSNWEATSGFSGSGVDLISHDTYVVMFHPAWTMVLLAVIAMGIMLVAVPSFVVKLFSGGKRP